MSDHNEDESLAEYKAYRRGLLFAAKQALAYAGGQKCPDNGPDALILFATGLIEGIENHERPS